MTTPGPDALRMRIELDPGVVRDPAWPEGISVRSFDPADAHALHALLVRGYSQGGGSVAEFVPWFSGMTSDEEYDPALFFLVESQAESRLAGAALCWTSAFVKDLVVDASWRRRGLGESLLRHVFATFAARGSGAVELKVEATNAGAIRLYERVGMRVVERLGLS